MTGFASPEQSGKSVASPITYLQCCSDMFYPSDFRLVHTSRPWHNVYPVTIMVCSGAAGIPHCLVEEWCNLVQVYLQTNVQLQRNDWFPINTRIYKNNLLDSWCNKLKLYTVYRQRSTIYFSCLASYLTVMNIHDYFKIMYDIFFYSPLLFLSCAEPGEANGEFSQPFYQWLCEWGGHQLHGSRWLSQWASVHRRRLSDWPDWRGQWCKKIINWKSLESVIQYSKIRKQKEKNFWHWHGGLYVRNSVLL